MKYVLKTLDECATRIEIIFKKIKALKKNEKLGKRDMNSMEWCITTLKATKRALEEDLKPQKPKTLANALDYVRGKTKDGTFVALLTEENHLIRTMYITKDILEIIPEYEVTVTPIEMKMNKIELSIPTAEFLKSIPKKAKYFIIIAKNGTEVKVLK